MCVPLYIFCKRLSSDTGQEQACSWINQLFVWLFVTMAKMAQNTGKWLLTAPSDHIQSETLFQARQDQEKGMNPVFCIVDAGSCSSSVFIRNLFTEDV